MSQEDALGSLERLRSSLAVQAKAKAKPDVNAGVTECLGWLNSCGLTAPEVVSACRAMNARACIRQSAHPKCNTLLVCPLQVLSALRVLEDAEAAVPQASTIFRLEVRDVPGCKQARRASLRAAEPASGFPCSSHSIREPVRPARRVASRSSQKSSALTLRTPQCSPFCVVCCHGT